MLTLLSVRHHVAVPVGRFHALFVTVSVPESAQPLCYLITCIKRDNCHVVSTTTGIDTAPPSLQLEVQVRVEAMTSD